MNDIFDMEEKGSRGKVVPLSEAVAHSVRPGMKLHFNIGADANAALREIIRQYRGKAPKFTLISSGVTTPDLVNLISSGLAEKVITTNCSYTYPSPRPIPLLQDLYRKGRIDIESWSLYSLEQRLMAAALGVGFMPTRSLLGSSLAEENRDAFQVVPNPFDRNERIGVVKALAPDLSIIHGCVADAEGNTVLAPPYFASLWGARASKEGVIVTVEKIVSTDFIRKRSALVKVPGHRVRHVCPVPLGAHPQGLASGSIGLKGYAEDYEFIVNFVEASRDPGRLADWMEEWIYRCSAQEDYLRKLGRKRIAFLKGRAKTGAGPEPRSASPSGFNATEMMIVAAAREIKEIVARRNYQVLLSGIGAPGLAAWLAFYLMKAEGRPIDLMAGTGQVGFSPRPGDPFLMSLSNAITCTMLTDTTDIYGVFVGGGNNRCLSVLGTAQVDPYGNLNTVKMGDLYFIGVGGAGDAVNASETLAMARQARDRFVEKVEFVGCPGRTVRTLVTDLGVFQKREEEETFTLTRLNAPPSIQGREDRLKEIKEKCGWSVNVGEALEEVLPPSAEELSILRALDPERIFLGK